MAPIWLLSHGLVNIDGGSLSPPQRGHRQVGQPGAKRVCGRGRGGGSGLTALRANVIPRRRVCSRNVGDEGKFAVGVILLDIRNSRFCLKIFLREQSKPNQSE